MLRYLLYLFHLINTQNYKKKQNWLQFLFTVKAAVLKQQISRFYPQILSTEDRFYIYDRPLTEINVIASFCALNFCFYNTRYVLNYADGQKTIKKIRWKVL